MRVPRANCRDSPLAFTAVKITELTAEEALILVIVYTPWGNAVFGTEPIRAEAWLFMLPFALAMLVLEELRKAVLRAGAGDRPLFSDKKKEAR